MYSKLASIYGILMNIKSSVDLFLIIGGLFLNPISIYIILGAYTLLSKAKITWLFILDSNLNSEA